MSDARPVYEATITRDGERWAVHVPCLQITLYTAEDGFPEAIVRDFIATVRREPADGFDVRVLLLE